MDFQQLMNLASKNQIKAEKKLPSSKKYSTEVSAPKKLQKVKLESDTLKKLREVTLKEKVKEREKGRVKEREREKGEEERDEINDYITERIKEQKRREDALRVKKMDKMRSKAHHDVERSKVRNEKQIERAKERRENIDERNLTPKMREKLKEERLRDKLREIKLKDKQEIQMTSEAATAESKKEGFRIPKSNSDGPKSLITNEKSAKSSTTIVTAGARPLYKIVSNQSDNSNKTTAVKKPVTKGAPPLDFNSLMKLASQTSSENKSSASIYQLNSKTVIDRPMTQEEKERHQRMSSKQFKEWYKYGTSPERRPESPTEKPKKETKIDASRKDKKSSENSKRTDSVNGNDSKKRFSSSSESKNSLSKSKTDEDLADKYKLLKQKCKALEEQLKHQENTKNQKSSSAQKSHNKQTSSKNSTNKYVVENNNLLICRPAAEKVPEKPKSAWDRIYDQIQKNDPIKKPVKRKRVIDSDEEDEDMADFIDDEPLEDEYSSNYSKCIREIFGYDRRRFQYDDDDDDNMETSYAQQMKEEIRSAKIGILEDLEDIRLEKEQKKKAKLKH